MDRHRRRLERSIRHDPAAKERLAFQECRMGYHTFQPDQIIESERFTQANKDVASCQCGQEVFDSEALCRHDYHRWHWSPWCHDLRYWCIRSLDLSLEERIARYSVVSEINPHVGIEGCTAVLNADDACQMGMHFEEITPEGYTCANPECDWFKQEECEHEFFGQLLRLSDGDQARCTRCQRVFHEEELCARGLHYPGPRSVTECYRPGCELYTAGTSLHEALAQSYKNGGEGLAYAVSRGLILAEARGWDANLRTYGVKRPKCENKLRKRSRWVSRRVARRTPRRKDKILIRVLSGSGVFRHNRSVPYNEINKELKTLWFGKWYPDVRKKEEV